MKNNKLLTGGLCLTMVAALLTGVAILLQQRKRTQFLPLKLLLLPTVNTRLSWNTISEKP